MEASRAPSVVADDPRRSGHRDGSDPFDRGLRDRSCADGWKRLDPDRLGDLEDEIVILAGHLHAGRQRFLVPIGRFDRARGWERAGHRTCASPSFSAFPDEDGMYVVKRRLNPGVGALSKRAVEAASDALYREKRPCVSAETSRRPGCDASVVSVLRGADGSVLDVGRRTRTIPGALRRALEVRDRGCRFPDHSPSASGARGLRFTDGHHLVHWADGGPTSLVGVG